MSNLDMSKDELDSVLHWRGKHAQVVRERDALQLLLNAADQRNDDLTVPPAGGEVEVMVWQVRARIKGALWQTWPYEPKGFDVRDTEIRELVDRAHVTRLQADRDAIELNLKRMDSAFASLSAERDALKAEVERLTTLYKDADEHMHHWQRQAESVGLVNKATQSELTKARECLKDLGVDWPEVADMYQYAPASKGEQS